MSLRNLTDKQLDEDYYWGTSEDHESIRIEWARRFHEREEHASIVEDERRDE